MIAGEHRLALPAGYQLGKYRFKSVLGAGGFGITYLAEDGSLGRRVAIKELLPNEIATRLDGSTVVAKTKSEEENLAWARDRFVQEGRALAACEHPNVVHVYEMIEANGTAYMVTKFEDGRSLAEWLKETGGSPTESELRSILMPLLAGLEKVHKAGFLHRDLKPENIYITDDGRPLLLDFGSARQAVSDRTTSLTSIVTSGYAPFEQYHEDGKQGAWTDIYALGAVMYRAIHGKKPPEATRRLKDDPCLKLAKEYSGKYSAQFLSAIDKALAVEPDRRPQDIAAWKLMLGAAPAEEQDVVEPWWLAGLEWAKTRPMAVAGGTAGVLIAGFVIWQLTQPLRVPDPQLATSAPQTATPVPSSATPVPREAPMPESPPTHVNPQPTEPQTNPPPAAPQDIPPAIVPARREVQEKRLVGNWAKEAVRKSDPTLRWEIMDDGRYSITSGETTIDTGTLTAAKGILSQTSETSGQTVAGMYQLRTATQIYTKGLPYSGTWKKVRTASVEPPHEPDKNIPSGDDKPSANNNSQTSNKKPNNGFSSAPKRDGTSVERKARDIGNSLRRRFGF